MMLMNRSPYFYLLFKALTFIPRRRPADAAVFLSTRSYSAASEAPQSSFMAEYLKLSVIIRHNPFVITQKAETLKASISRVEGLGVARTSGMFHLILMSLTCVSEKNFEAHLEFFKGFGWSEDDFVAAFRMAPTLVRCSLKSLQRKMEFLINEIRCTPSYLANRPVILLYSLEKRLIPRYRILTGLKSRGVKVSNLQMVTYMRYTEKKFLEKFGVSRMH
ncbi:hypothetical protein OPV22_015772 [Ensete ventricosum]|uniref:Uncharacterized protein n=1 Tax=Ensete ventricosum TaxID=4639 RepID=A0AAV8RA82_ENSVE|nr:hypothetical protein OPV22_015772 [Ensete ventricosum]